MGGIGMASVGVETGSGSAPLGTAATTMGEDTKDSPAGLSLGNSTT